VWRHWKIHSESNKKIKKGGSGRKTDDTRGQKGEHKTAEKDIQEIGLIHVKTYSGNLVQLPQQMNSCAKKTKIQTENEDKWQRMVADLWSEPIIL